MNTSIGETGFTRLSSKTVQRNTELPEGVQSGMHLFESCRPSERTEWVKKQMPLNFHKQEFWFQISEKKEKIERGTNLCWITQRVWINIRVLLFFWETAGQVFHKISQVFCALRRGKKSTGCPEICLSNEWWRWYIPWLFMLNHLATNLV